MSNKEFYNMVKVKTDLIIIKEDKLLQKVTDLEYFNNFISGLETILKKEDAFLLLSKAFTTKIEKIINMSRFNITDASILAKLNFLTTKINELKNQPKNIERMKVLNYISYQNELRHLNYPDLATFLGAMSLDLEILEALLNYDISDYKSDEAFLSSTNYFMNVNPSLYDDMEIRYITKEKLKKIQQKPFSFKDRYMKKYTKQTITSFKNIWG